MYVHTAWLDCLRSPPVCQQRRKRCVRCAGQAQSTALWKDPSPRSPELAGKSTPTAAISQNGFAWSLQAPAGNCYRAVPSPAQLSKVRKKKIDGFWPQQPHSPEPRLLQTGADDAVMQALHRRPARPLFNRNRMFKLKHRCPALAVHVSCVDSGPSLRCDAQTSLAWHGGMAHVMSVWHTCQHRWW